jgi:hypothetical protein
MKIIPVRLTAIMIIFAIMSCFPADPLAGQDLPFHPGEKMAFEVRWSGILAGEAVIELLPVEDLNGVESYHLVFTDKTSPFVDIFYKVRDTIDSYTDAEMTHSLLYKQQIHEGRSKKEITVQFNWERQEAKYSLNGNDMDPISIMPGTFDPLSVFYAFRLHDLNKEIEYNIPLTDGKKLIMGKAKVIRREDIKVAGVSYDTFLVEPGMEDIGGVFEKSRNAKIQIWVTADDRHVPVRIKSKVAIGSFVAELVSFENGLTAGEPTEDSP